jgi:hypothetical protein
MRIFDNCGNIQYLYELKGTMLIFRNYANIQELCGCADQLPGWGLSAKCIPEQCQDCLHQERGENQDLVNQEADDSQDHVHKEEVRATSYTNKEERTRTATPTSR